MRVTGNIVIDERWIEERFVRSSGPGGQNVNKVATAVELILDVPAAGLPADLQSRLESLAGKRLTADRRLLTEAHEHRTQARNREAARARLLDLLRQAARRPKRRRATKPTAAAREKRLASKQHRGRLKQSRGRLPRDE